MSGILQDLFPIIYTTATGNSAFNTSVGGRIFQELAESADGTPFNTYPYAVFRHVSDIRDFSYSSDMSDLLFRWMIFDNNSSSSVLQDVVTKLHTAFDEVRLVVPNWNFIRIMNTNHTIIAKDENGIRISVTTYRVLTSKV